MASEATASEHMTWILATAVALFLGGCLYGMYYLFFRKPPKRPHHTPESAPVASDTAAGSGRGSASDVALTSGTARSEGATARSEPQEAAAETEDTETTPLVAAEFPGASSRPRLGRRGTMEALGSYKWGRTEDVAMESEGAEESDKRSAFSSARGLFGTAMKSVKSAVTSIGDIEETRVINYDTQALGTWAVFTYTAGTVMQSGRLWRVMSMLTCIVLLCGVLVNILPKPQEVDPGGFRKIATFLKVFVAFLIGFFMTSALTTWKNTVAGFLQLCHSVRNTQMQLLVFGVDDEKVDLVVRYGALSVVFLVKELEMAHRNPKKKTELEAQMFAELVAEGHVLPNERERLIKVEDRAELMWVWITSLMARLSEDGEVPAMSSPTFGRILQQAQGGEEGIRQVHTAISIQIPFIYVHTLAGLVHINNILCAVSLGMSLGISVGTMMIRLGVHPIVHRDPKDDLTEVGPAMQKILVALLAEGVGPFMYTAFLQIALSLAYPFGEDSRVAQIPHNTFITKLMHGCDHAKTMAEDPPGWERPRFKKKHHHHHPAEPKPHAKSPRRDSAAHAHAPALAEPAAPAAPK